MSTANKLTYLNETKTKLKNVINYSGANITNDTFRSYPEKLYDKFVDFVTNGTDSLYSSLPKVTGENTELTLNNTSNGVLKLNFKGNTSQKSTSGKNKFDVSQIEIGRSWFGGSNSSRARFYIEYTPNDNYTISLINIPEEISGVVVVESSSVISQSGTNKFSQGIINNSTFTHKFNSEATYLILQFQADTTFTKEIADTIKIQIEEGTEATEYEDFTGNKPSPNPDYPQQIHVATGDNDVKIENKNLAQYKNGYIIPTTGVFKSSNDDCFYFPVVQGETYYCQSTGNRTVGAIYTSIPVAEQTCIQGTNIPDVPKNGSFVASATGIMVVYANTPTSQSVIDTFIVTKGNTAPSSYTPHQEQTYRLDFGGKNKFDKDTTNVLNAYFDNVAINITANNSNRTIYLPCKPNTTYSIKQGSSSLSNHLLQIANTDEEPQIGTQTYNFQNHANDLTFTYTTNSTARYIAIRLRVGDYVDSFLSTIQIEEGTEATRYSRYVENPIEMCEIGDYQDYLYKDNGKWYVHKEIGKAILTGVENWKTSSNYVGSYYISGNIGVISRTIAFSQLYCNCFTRADISNQSQISQNYKKNTCFIENNEGALNMWYGDNTTSVQDFKDYLSNNNASLYYVLATSTETEITDTTLISQLEALENAVSYEDQTNISQTNADLPFVFSASAIKKYSE